MRRRPLAHRLLALVLGVLALQLTLWGASPACATPSAMGAASGHARMAAAAPAASSAAEHAGIAPSGMAGDVAADAPTSAPAHCPMPLVPGGCVTPACAAGSLALEAETPPLLVANGTGEPGWASTVYGPTRSLVPDVPPPRA